MLFSFLTPVNPLLGTGLSSALKFNPVLSDRKNKPCWTLNQTIWLIHITLLNHWRLDVFGNLTITVMFYENVHHCFETLTIIPVAPCLSRHVSTTVSMVSLVQCKEPYQQHIKVFTYALIYLLMDWSWPCWHPRWVLGLKLQLLFHMHTLHHWGQYWWYAPSGLLVGVPLEFYTLVNRLLHLHCVPWVSSGIHGFQRINPDGFGGSSWSWQFCFKVWNISISPGWLDKELRMLQEFFWFLEWTVTMLVILWFFHLMPSHCYIFPATYVYDQIHVKLTTFASPSVALSF